MRADPDHAVRDAAPPATAVTVTVVLCTRNGHSRGFLGAALDSVFAQSHAPFEVLVIDDGSSDDTCAMLAAGYPGVRVLANAGRGLAAARNTGVRAARGSWIAFVDDDDVWYPHKLAEQVRQAGACPEPTAAIIAARNDHIDQHGAQVPTPMSLHFASWPSCLLGSPVTPSGVMLTKALLLRVGLFDESIADGSAYECWIRCLAVGATVHYSSGVLLHYRRHPAQMTVMARRVAQLLAHEIFIMEHVAKLPPVMAARMGTARLLCNTRSLLAHCGLGGALHYWRAARLPCSPGWRVLSFAALDAAACRAPQRSARVLRRWAYLVLLGGRHGA